MPVTEEGFAIEQSADSLSGYSQIATVGVDVTTYAVGSLSPDTKYFFRVRAYNGIDNSAYTNIIGVTTATAPSTGDGLQAYWPVDNSTADVSGNGFDLTLFNGATFTTDHQQGSHALSLDGADDYAASPSIDLGNTFTLAAWVKIPSGRFNIQTLIANGSSGANSNGFKVLVNTYGTADRRISFESGNGSVAAISRSNTNVFDFGTWNHLAITVDRSTGQARIFYNGTDVTAESGVHTGFKNNDVIRLGRMTNNAYAMGGALDDIRIYNRVLSQSEIAAVMSGVVPPTLNAPSSLNASLSGSDVQLTWTDNSSDEDGFYLERSLSETSGFSVIQTLAANATTFTDNTVVEGTRYYYRVKAFNSSTGSSYSNTATILVVTAPPAAPSALMASAVTYNSLQLSWTDNAVTEEGFAIEQSADSLSGYSQIATVGVDVTTYAVGSLSPDTKYFFRVRAFNGIDNSPYTNIIGVTTATAPSTGDGLQAYWPVDNSTADVSGNGFDLTLFNGATFTTDHQQGSHALSLDGADDYAASPSIDLGNTFTLAAWVKIPSGRFNIQTLIANGSSGANSNGFKVLVNTYGTADRRIAFESGNGSVAAISRSNTNVFDFGTWNHLAITVDRSTGQARIFYNGTDVTAESGVHTGFKNNDVIRLGRMTNNAYAMGGALDDIRIYNRVLSQSEIAAVMSGVVPPTLNAPSSLNASLSGRDVQLTWTDNSSDEDGFYLERSLSETSGFSVIQTLAANATSFTDNTVVEGTRYYYRVKAFNSSTTSSYSNTATILVVTAPPAAPSALMASGVTYNSLQLSWTDNASTEEGFAIEQSADSLSGYSQIATVGVDVTTYAVGSLSPDTKYFFRVRAYNGIDNSAYTNITGVTTATAPSTGDGLQAYWPVDNSTADVSGNGFDLTLFNGATFTTDHQQGSHALSLDGADDYAASPSIDLGNTFTLAAWVKIPSGRFNIQTLIANGSSGANSNGFKVLVNTYGTADRRISFESGNGSVAAISRSNTNVFNFGTWNHLAITVDRSTGQARIFYNGTDVTAESGVHTGFKNNDVIRLGRMTNNAYAMGGALDDIRIYNRVLSPSEITSLFAPPVPSIMKEDYTYTGNSKNVLPAGSGDVQSPGMGIPGGTKANEVDGLQAVVVYPNPFHSELKISNAGPVRKVELMDLTGKIIRQEENEGQTLHVLRLNDAARGMYILRLTDMYGNIDLIKVVRY